MLRYMQGLRVQKEEPPDWVGYESVPAGFWIESRLDLRQLIELKGKELREIPEPRRWKDYDASPLDCPSALPRQFDTSNWAVFSVFREAHRLGGAIVAFQSHDFEMLRGRDDLAVMVDLRVHPEVRGGGLGRSLFQAALDWTAYSGGRELIVETQDTNVAACRFYRAMGCELLSADPDGYGLGYGEAKLLWRLRLPRTDQD
jgi:ribosomal protein S18 acetylase RimI-like enzyme